jgi:hypothetical protein
MQARFRRACDASHSNALPLSNSPVHDAFHTQFAALTFLRCRYTMTGTVLTVPPMMEILAMLKPDVFLLF